MHATGRWFLLIAILLVSLPIISPGQAVLWFVAETVRQLGVVWPGWVWPLVSWGLLLAPVSLAVVGAFWAREPVWRAVFRAWAGAGLVGAALALSRSLPSLSDDGAPAVQLALGLLLLAALLIELRFRPRPLPAGSGSWLAFACSLLVLSPFLVWGAAGGWVEALLVLGASLVTGLVISIGVTGVGLGPLYQIAPLPQATYLRSALVWTVALSLVLPGLGLAGSQLIYGLAPFGLGLLAAALSHVSRPVGGWLAPAIVVGFGLTAGHWFDPDELNLYLIGDGLITAAVLASLVSAVLAGLLAGLLVAGDRLRVPWQSAGLGVALAVVAAPGAGGLYVGIGQPGAYGERLFVILRVQADVSQAARIPDRTERLALVYSTLTEQAMTEQAELRAWLDGLGIAYTPYYLINAIEVHDDNALLRWYLAGRADVDRVLISPRLRPLFATPTSAPPAPTPAPGIHWNIRAIGADRVWAEYQVRGEGIVIGQSDSGVDADHPALAGQYRGTHEGTNDYNWLDPWENATAPADRGGHGTHTLGSVLGADGIGVAPEATWFACRNLDRNLGNPALYLDCLQFMLAPYPAGADPFAAGDVIRAAHVLNNSWGCPEIEGCDPEALRPAVQALRAAGIFVVVSAGNAGPSCGSVTSPLSNYPEVFSVGAVNSESQLASFSSRGPAAGTDAIKPDIVAPGVDILSAIPGGGYASQQGTSMAGPHVAGVVALLWSANNNLIGDIDRTEAILRETAQPLPDTANNDQCPGANDAGAGLVDAYAAVSAALADR